MTKPIDSPLSDEQRRQILAVLRIGGDRETAVRVVGQTKASLQTALVNDPQFAQDVRQAEAAAKLIHMQNIHNAAQDPRDWRASQWWLERRYPARFARQKEARREATGAAKQRSPRSR